MPKQPRGAPTHAGATPLAGLLAEGARLHEAGRLGEAEQRYRQVLAANPRQPDTLHLLGMVAHQAGHQQAALGLIDQALAVNRRHPLYLTNRGVVLMALGRADEALAMFEKAADLDPRFPPALVNLGRCLLDRGRPADAVRPLRRALQLQPGQPGHHEMLARALAAAERPEDAVQAFRAALAIDPARLSAATGLGSALSDLGRFDEALALYRPLVALHPGEAGLLFNVGLALRRSGRAAEALDWLDRAHAVAPLDADIAHSRALARMSAGDFAQGLVDYERRFDKVPPDSPRRVFPQPEWRGGPVAGRLLVWAEQGPGDHLLFARLLPEVARQGIRCLMECDPRLEAMLARSYPDHDFVPRADPSDARTLAPDIGAQVALGGLMLRLAPWPRDFRPPGAAIVPDPARVREMRESLASLGPGPRIGLSWRSNNKRQGVDKTLPLDRWGPILAGRDAIFVNLQYGDTDKDIASAQAALGCRIHTIPGLDRFIDIEGVIAATQALDLVVSTSNITAHLAGAIGKPCLLLLQHVPLWYWGLGGAATLFYPSVQAFRQDRPGSWEPGVTALAERLDRYLSEPGSFPPASLDERGAPHHLSGGIG